MLNIQSTIKILLVLLAISIPCYAGDTSNLEGMWLLNEGSGTRVDETDNSNDLTDNNTVLSATGQFGDAADFESTNSEYLNITDGAQTGLDPFENASDHYSIGFWINAESTAADAFLAEKSTTGAYGVRLQAANTIRVLHVSTQCNTTTTVTDATWTHIAVTWDGSDVRIYIDGGTVDTTCADSASPTNTTGPFALGARSAPAGNNPYDGLIDEAFFFSRAISSAEIDDIKDNGLESFVGGRKDRVIVIS